MAYSYPTKINTVSADVANVATALAQRQSDSATINGGIVASGGSAAVPQLGADSAGLGAAYLAAIADVTMAACGVQVCDSSFGSTASTTSASFVDANAAYADLTFTAPIAKSYLVHVDVSFFASTGAPTTIGFLGVKNVTSGVSCTPPTAQTNIFANSVIIPLSFRALVPMSAGANVLRLIWKVTGGTLNANGNCARVITVSG